MKPSVDEIRRELDRIVEADFLSPQERALLRRIVERTVDGDIGRLYQKALAEDLGIASAKQIGVIATQLRAKLADHYRSSQGLPAVLIELPDRGYEARFSYRQPAVLAERGRPAPGRQCQGGDRSAAPCLARASRSSSSDRALEAEPGHPLILALKAYCHATRALYGTYPRVGSRDGRGIVNETRGAADSSLGELVRRGVRPHGAALGLAGRGGVVHPGDCRERRRGAVSTLVHGLPVVAGPGRRGRGAAARRGSRSHDSPIVRADLAAVQIYAGRFDDAEETIKTAFALFGERSHYLLHVHRAVLHEARGDSAGALATIEQVPLKWPRTAITLGLRALFSGLSGDRRTARRHFAEAQGGPGGCRPLRSGRPARPSRRSALAT